METNLENLCKELSKCGTVFQPYKKNPVKGLNFVVNTDNNRKAIRLWVNKDQNLVKVKHFISRKHKQAVLQVTEVARDVTVELRTYTNVKLTNAIVGKIVRTLPGDHAYIYSRAILGEDARKAVVIPNSTITVLGFTPYKSDNSKYIGQQTYKVQFRITAPQQTHNILLGTDESHTFISFLPSKASSVEQAHTILKPKGLDSAKYLRQGELFFTPVEDSVIYDMLAKYASDISTRVELDDFSSEVHDYDENGTGVAAGHVFSLAFLRHKIIYVLGNVEHPRHKTLKLPCWHRLWVNTELPMPDNSGFLD